ncbi:hypothetical protein BS47DRAFT_579260 [Hydnum rufescens UP504]|uniref:Uncharacterized protein n=1 Tax=Hydnum rufescens UP504 TaxID=1448309 RepID=A0A9P6DN98_9AGAM|nr:hypothetical protein BS47DRAFT_579260 [Hydnum rufescens UP504]
MAPKSLLTLYGLNDTVLGLVGGSIPQSEGLDHAVRYFGTWSGSDKLMMTVQYTGKIVAPTLRLRALLQYTDDLRDAPFSPTADGLSKLSETLSAARRVSGLWGILPIIKWLSSIERSNPTSRAQLTIERIQALSMLAFYILETISFFASPAAPLIPRSVLSERGAARASLWSVRAWGLYTVLQIVHLRNDWKEAQEETARSREERSRARLLQRRPLRSGRRSRVSSLRLSLIWRSCRALFIGPLLVVYLRPSIPLPCSALSLLWLRSMVAGRRHAYRLPHVSPYIYKQWSVYHPFFHA